MVCGRLLYSQWILDHEDVEQPLFKDANKLFHLLSESMVAPGTGLLFLLSTGLMLGRGAGKNRPSCFAEPSDLVVTAASDCRVDRWGANITANMVARRGNAVLYHCTARHLHLR